MARALARPAGRRGADHVDHERRARAHVDLRRARGPARDYTRAGLRARARARRRASSGPRTARRSSGCSVHLAHARRATSSIPDALTIGFARRFATYKRAGLLFSQPERLSRAARAIPSGRSRSSSPARRTRGRGRQGRDPAGGRVRARRAAARPRRLPRGLRDDARAAARAGRRRVAQHAAPPDGGVGHVGDEGGAERRAELLDPRRLVGGGRTRPRSRLRDRRASDGRRDARRSRTAADARGALRGARATGDSRRTTSATRTGLPAALGRDDAALDRRLGDAVQHEPHGAGVRRAASTCRRTRL